MSDRKFYLLMSTLATLISLQDIPYWGEVVFAFMAGANLVASFFAHDEMPVELTIYLVQNNSKTPSPFGIHTSED